MKNIPYSVIGADAKTIQELSGLWLEINNLRKRLAEQSAGRGTITLSPEAIKSLRQRLHEANISLANHRIRVQILRELDLQLQALNSLAERHQKTDVADKYKKIQSIILELLKKTSISPEDELRIEQDPIYQEIKFWAKNIS